jgi:hypothetical protein
METSFEMFYSMKIPAHLRKQWERAEDEGRDNAAHTDMGGKLLGYKPHDESYQDMFISTVALVSVMSEGYTDAFRKWLAKCGIVG